MGRGRSGARKPYANRSSGWVGGWAPLIRPHQLAQLEGSITLSLCLYLTRIDMAPRKYAALTFVSYGFILILIRVRCCFSTAALDNPSQRHPVTAVDMEVLWWVGASFSVVARTGTAIGDFFEV